MKISLILARISLEDLRCTHSESLTLNPLHICVNIRKLRSGKKDIIQVRELDVYKNCLITGLLFLIGPHLFMATPSTPSKAIQPYAVCLMCSVPLPSYSEYLTTQKGTNINLCSGMLFAVDSDTNTQIKISYNDRLEAGPLQDMRSTVCILLHSFAIPLQIKP